MNIWGIGAIIAVAALFSESGKAYLKKAVRSGVRAGYKASAAAGVLTANAKQYKDQLVSEIKEEKEERLKSGYVIKSQE
jgi:hypothetical protein